MGKEKGGLYGKVDAAESPTAMDSVTAALRKMHDDIAAEPIPDDFMDLLDKIDAKMSASKKA
jgi:Anti-sigma factor NepR